VKKGPQQAGPHLRNLGYRLSLDDNINQLARNKDFLDDLLAGDDGLHFFVSQSEPHDFFFRRFRRDDDPAPF